VHLDAIWAGVALRAQSCSSATRRDQSKSKNFRGNPIDVKKLKATVRLIIANFGPLIGFYVANRFLGLKAAIAATLLITLAELLRVKIKRQKMTLFFTFSSVIALTFGIIDFSMESPVLLKFEAGVINLLFAGFFAASLLREKSIIEELAEQQGRIEAISSADKTFFFRALTAAWIIYFLAKAAAYTWIGFNSTLEQGMLLRALIGNLSMAAMFFISIGLARPLWRAMLTLRLMPSTKS